MRIFYASDITPNSSFQSSLWRNNLLLPLLDLGHDVVEFDFDFRKTFQNLDPADPKQKVFIKKNRPILSNELLEQIKITHAKQKIDVFFSYFYDACVLPEAIDEIRSMGIKTVNWYCNGSYQLHLVSEISPHYDWCLVPEKFRLKDYVAMGARPIYCQEAANPNIYKPYNLPQEYDVSFVGQAYGDRPGYIKFLLDAGIDVRVWGYGWNNYSSEAKVSTPERNPFQRTLYVGKKLLTVEGWHAVGRKLKKIAPSFQGSSGESIEKQKTVLPDNMLGGTLSDLEMIQMYSRSKINIGFSTCGNTHETGERIVQVRLRDFEVPMSGGFYMVEYMEELEEFFEIGKEIVCYTGPGDLAEKIKYYLTHDSEREAIRMAGYERCKRDHTWHKRFQTAFKEMGLE
jgi:spore maturation protein CgeB